MILPSPEWFPDWRDERVVIIASGPSAGDRAYCDLPAKVIVTNDSWRLYPGADVLYASDAEWWASGKGDGFAGLKVSRSGVAGVHKVDLRKIGHDAYADTILMDRMGEVGAGGSSGFQALNLALQFGSRRIALVGFDCKRRDRPHWHQDHGRGLRNPTDACMARWARHLNEASVVVADLGATIVNCCPDSAVTAYPVETLEDFLCA